MLQINLPDQEFWDPVKEEFITIKAITLKLEHSLVSLSKWERIWKKPYLSLTEKSNEEFASYVKCMTIQPKDVPYLVYKNLPDNIVASIIDYLNDPMTATSFPKERSKNNREIITAEIIYYQMFSLNIPIECEKWNLNRLMAQIRVCALKNSPKKKMNRRDVMSQNAALNTQRRKALKSKG